MAKGNKVAMKLHLEEKKQCEEFTWSTHQGDLASPESGGGASYFPSELEDERASASEYESVEGEDWMEEWGAVTIQSLIRGYLARKRVRQWKKRRLRVSRMRRHRKTPWYAKQSRSRPTMTPFRWKDGNDVIAEAFVTPKSSSVSVLGKYCSKTTNPSS